MPHSEVFDLIVQSGADGGKNPPRYGVQVVILQQYWKRLPFYVITLPIRCERKSISNALLVSKEQQQQAARDLLMASYAFHRIECTGQTAS